MQKSCLREFDGTALECRTEDLPPENEIFAGEEDQDASVEHEEQDMIHEAPEDEDAAADWPEDVEDLVQVYFRSVNKTPLLSRDAETELAIRMEEGRNIIRDIVCKTPLHGSLRKKLQPAGREEDDDAGLVALTIGGMREHLAGIREAEKELAEGRAGAKSPESAASREALALACRRAERNVGVEVQALKQALEQIDRVQEAVARAKDELVTRNLRLVVALARSCAGRGLPLLDLIQEGNIGLMKAADRFRHDRGCKFSTYAIWWIRQAMTRALMDQAKTIRVPVHVTEFYGRIVRARRRLNQELGREATHQEIAAQLKIPLRKIEETVLAVQDTIALQSTIGDEEAELGDFITDLTTPSPCADLERTETARRIRVILRTLPPREAKVIKMRFGIGVERNHTLEEVGRHLRITRERVRQIEFQALRLLRHPNRLSALQEVRTA